MPSFAKALIAAYYMRYPTIHNLHARVEKAVLLSRKSTGKLTPKGFPAGEGVYVSETGRRYIFNEYDAPDWLAHKKDVGFSPTEMKNYPIQGEGGEIVQGICGRLWRHFIFNGNYNNKAFLCNTVHDCVWIDCHEDVYKEVARDVKRIMEDVQGWYDQFDIKITVPFPVEVEAGRNMLELKHIED